MTSHPSLGARGAEATDHLVDATLHRVQDPDLAGPGGGPSVQLRPAPEAERAHQGVLERSAVPCTVGPDPHDVRQRPVECTCHRRLADARRPPQGDGAPSPQLGGERSDFGIAPDERRTLGWRIRGACSGRRWCRSLGRGTHNEPVSSPRDRLDGVDAVRPGEGAPRPAKHLVEGRLGDVDVGPQRALDLLASNERARAGRQQRQQVEHLRLEVHDLAVHPEPPLVQVQAPTVVDREPFRHFTPRRPLTSGP